MCCCVLSFVKAECDSVRRRQYQSDIRCCCKACVLIHKKWSNWDCLNLLASRNSDCTESIILITMEYILKRLWSGSFYAAKARLPIGLKKLTFFSNIPLLRFAVICNKFAKLSVKKYCVASHAQSSKSAIRMAALPRIKHLCKVQARASSSTA